MWIYYEASYSLIFLFKTESCNSILHGLPSCELENLQPLQNTAARLTVREKKVGSHHSNVLKSLYWLPLKERINFKINELLFNYTPHRLIRSSSLNLLSISKTRTVTDGDRSFSLEIIKHSYMKIKTARVLLTTCMMSNCPKYKHKNLKNLCGQATLD